MPIRKDIRGEKVVAKHVPHVAIIRSGPRAGETHSCDCTRRKDHYMAMAPGMMDLHPKLF